MTYLWRRASALFVSHRFRSYCMVGFYLGILVTGVLGVVAPSASATRVFGTEDPEQPQRFLEHVAVVLWTALYGITAPIGAIARLRSWYSAELLALILIVLGTSLHAYFLIDSGMPGYQTGFRLLSGVLALLAVASMLRELALTERDGNLVVDPEYIRGIVAREVAARQAGRGAE